MRITVESIEPRFEDADRQFTNVKVLFYWRKSRNQYHQVEANVFVDKKYRDLDEIRDHALEEARSLLRHLADHDPEDYSEQPG
jgi:hypothetical protein